MVSKIESVMPRQNKAGVYESPPISTGSLAAFEKLENLPEGSIIRDRDGDAWQKMVEDYWCAAGGAQFVDSCYVAEFFPIQVLWEGGGDGKAAQHT